jgi:hypothetical protein
MMSSGSPTKAMHSGADGKCHINESVFIDMIVLAPICPFLEGRIARRSLSLHPGIREGR